MGTATTVPSAPVRTSTPTTTPAATRPPATTPAVARPPTADAERERARVVAAAVVGAAAAAEVPLDDRLLIWPLAGGMPAPGAGTAAPGAAGVDALAAVLEGATDGPRRRAQGLHVTPRWLADRLVAPALPPEVASLVSPDAGGSAPAATVCDPACGGGAFLLAAARRLHAAGIPRHDVVRGLLWGADIDAVGVAAAEAALWLWAGERPPEGRLVVADALLAEGDLWPAAGHGAPGAGFAAVVGNPPFQSQLGRATARSAADQRRLRARFGGAVRAYTDTAWLFLLVACDMVRPGGRVVMVEPQSVVAARDAEAVRAALDERAELHDLWLDDERVFDAAVRVCAPVLVRRGGAAPDRRPEAGSATWGQLWARALDLPVVDLPAGPTLGDRATVIAGFRDQYYGLVDTVREHEPPDDEAGAPLVTSGAVDWASCAWGARPTRYAKRRWVAPVVDRERLEGAPPIARRWVARTRVPKLVVATQTRIVEAAVDVGGTWVPSVPTLAVIPASGPGDNGTDPDELWRLAAAVLSPAATAWLARRSAGTGLDRGALKVAGPDLVALPLPGDAAAWDAAAVALRAFVDAPVAGALDAYLDAAARAYGVSPLVTAWWRGRAGTAVRTGGTDG